MARKRNPKHIESVRALGCCVCRNLGFGITTPEYTSVHHIRTGFGWGQKAPDEMTIGLCFEHHQGKDGYHTAPQTWQEKYGTETELLEQVRRLLVAEQ